MRTEQIDPRYADLDSWSAAEMIAAMYEGQLAAAGAVRGALGPITKAVEDAVPALKPDEIVLVFYANDFAGEPPFTSERIRPPFEPRYRPAWLPRIVQVTRRLIAGEPVALRWHGGPKAFLAAVPVAIEHRSANGMPRPIAKPCA